MTPETPFEDDTQEELEPDDTRYMDFTALRESFEFLEKRIREAFTNPQNIARVISAIDRNPEMHKNYRLAQAWLVREKVQPTETNSLTTMIIRMLQDEEKSQRVMLWDFYKKLGFE